MLCKALYIFKYNTYDYRYIVEYDSIFYRIKLDLNTYHTRIKPEDIKALNKPIISFFMPFLIGLLEFLSYNCLSVNDVQT